MPDLQCARCGRTEPPSEGDQAAWTLQRMEILEPEGDPLIGLLGSTWASINGEDVCPKCQTGAERRDLARRIIAAIEGEVNRSAALNMAPSRVEPGLVPFAMQLREALTAQSSPEDLSPQRRHIKLDVAITGAFLTGCPLRIGIADYEEVQRKLATKLSENTGAGWKTSGDELRQGTYYSGGGFSEVLPLILVCREGADALARARAIFNCRPKNEHDWLDPRIDGWTVTPTSMRIEVYDLGVAVINGTFAVGVPAKMSLAAAARELKRMVWLRPDSVDKVSSPITGMFRKLSIETTRQFRASVVATVPDQRQRPWLASSDSTRESSPDWGRLLWLHPVHMLASEDPAMRGSSAKELAPAFSRSVEVPDGQFVPGIGWSAIVTDLDRSARDVPMKLLHLHWAYIALYMEIDRGLLAVLDRNESRPTPSVLSELEADAETVFADYIRAMEARARVDSALAGLGGDEQAIWDVIADVTKFDALVSGVDRKVEVLQRIAERRVQQATSASDRRSARILGSLTALTFVTLAIAVIGYVVGGLSDKDLDDYTFRWVFLVVGFVFAVTTWGVAFVWPRRKSRKARRSGYEAQS